MLLYIVSSWVGPVEIPHRSEDQIAEYDGHGTGLHAQTTLQIFDGVVDICQTTLQIFDGSRRHLPNLVGSNEPAPVAF